MEPNKQDLYDLADISKLFARLIDYDILNVKDPSKTSKKLMHIYNSINHEKTDIFKKGDDDYWQNIT